MGFIKDLFKPEIIWFVIGIVLLILEFAVPGVIILFFGIGALVVGVMNIIFDPSLDVQLIIFILTSLLLLITMRRYLKTVFTGKVNSAPDEDDGNEDIIGNTVIVIKEITPEMPGKVEFRGTSWNAVAEEKIEKGKRARITGKESITLQVKKL